MILGALHCNLVLTIYLKMKTNTLLVTVLFFIISTVNAQTNINNYKYVIVPKKFDFLKEANKYRLNELTQFLFNKQGIKAIMEGEGYPIDLQKDRCLGLRSDVMKETGMFKTKLKVVLKDCNDKEVYALYGENREKEYKTAYTMAIRDAFKTFKYKYQPTTPIQEPEVTIEETITVNKEELANKKTVKIETASPNVLYAQKTAKGFQLVDSSPKVIYKMNATGVENVFLVEGKSAIIYKKDSQWVIEYYLNNVLKNNNLNIKW